MIHVNKVFFFFIFIAFNVSGQNRSLDVIYNSNQNSHLLFNNGNVEFHKVENKGELFTGINFDGLSKSYDIGNPDLPVYSKLIEVPADGSISISVINKYSSS